MVVLDRVRVFVGELARPYVLIATGTATAKVIWSSADPAVIFAAGALVGALYGARALENYGQARVAAKAGPAGAE